MVQDRFRAASAESSRVLEALEAALRVGQGRVNVHGAARAAPSVWRFSTDLHCADCDIHYRDPTPNLFSFNSPLGACETCRGFGRMIGIDYGLVVPDESKTLRGGAVRPWQTQSYSECQDDLVKFARKRGVPLDVPWRELSEEHRRWVLDGEGPLGERQGLVRGEALLRVAREHELQDAHPRAAVEVPRLHGLPGLRRRAPQARGAAVAAGLVGTPDAAAGLNIHDLMLLPIDRVSDVLRPPARCRRRSTRPPTCCSARSARGSTTWCESGLGYLTLDRQSRTLSGGEVQRINLTTALGTSLVNTLFVLDEPSIGLHPRDMRRVIEVMQRLRDAGNSLVVVEHDPQIMLAADRIVDIGPGPGERGGRIVFFGTAAELAATSDTLTAEYLSGRKRRRQRRRPPRSAAPGEPRLVVRGAAEHNLKDIDVEIPLGGWCASPACRARASRRWCRTCCTRRCGAPSGKPTETPGAHRALAGAEHVGDVVMVDQTPSAGPRAPIPRATSAPST